MASAAAAGVERETAWADAARGSAGAAGAARAARGRGLVETATSAATGPRSRARARALTDEVAVIRDDDPGRPSAKREGDVVAPEAAAAADAPAVCVAAAPLSQADTPRSNCTPACTCRRGWTASRAVGRAGASSLLDCGALILVRKPLVDPKEAQDEEQDAAEHSDEAEAAGASATPRNPAAVAVSAAPAAIHREDEDPQEQDDHCG